MRAMRDAAFGVLAFCLSACGDDAPAKSNPGGAGSPASGGSAGSGGSSGGGGSPSAGGGGALEDPPAAQPDLTGLVTTSAKWLLVTETQPIVVSSSLDFVDLESGMRYPVNPQNLPVAYSYWSPDQKTFLFSGADADSDKNLTILRLEKNGFVPAKLVEGYEGTRGNFGFIHWDENSRFCTIARGGSMTDGVEVVDTVLGKRVGHVDIPPTFSHTFAPKGFYFSYMHGDSTMYESGLARVLKDGISTPTVLPAGSYRPGFSHDGKRAFFGRRESEITTQYYLDLPDLTPKELVVTAEGEKLNGSASAGPTADSVLAYVQTTDADRRYVQAFVDGRPRVDLSDPAKKVRFTFASDDSNVVAVDYETSLEIVRVEPFARHPLPGTTVMDAADYWTTGVVGQHVYHQVDGQLFVASIDAAGALTDVAVSMPGEQLSVCTFYGSHQPTTKLAYRTVGAEGAGGELVVVDLAASPPAVAARIVASSPETGLYCPEFSTDESAMVATETAAEGGGKVYGVKWTAGVATEPEILLESTGGIEVRAFSY